MNIRLKIRSFISSDNDRSNKAKKNIAFSALLKCGSIAIIFLLVPLSINYVNKAEYGIWLTLSVIISWMNFFDIGLGNGLRNKLAETNALGQTENARILVSTTYALIVIVAFCLFLIFLVVNTFIDWSRILNTGALHHNFNTIALLVFSIFCIRFITQLLNSVLIACHLVSRVSLLLLISQITTLIGVIFLTKFTQSSLVLLILINGCAPIIVSTLASVWYYNRELKEYSPSIKLIKFQYAKELVGMGGMFFFIQIGALVLFQTDNIVVVQMFGPVQVTTFNIAYRLFSSFILSFDIIIGPFWSAFTEAYAKGDLTWIKLIVKKMRHLFLIISFGSLVLFFFAPFIYKIWLNNTIVVPTSLSLAMALYVMAYIWHTLHVNLLNGINKIRLQLYIIMISALVNLPVAIFLGDKIGLAGVTMANVVVLVVMGLILSYQVTRILSKTATGIFNA